MMLKSIDTLTDQEGEEILEFVYPDKIKDYCYRGLSFISTPNENGEIQVTLSMQPIVGILYTNWNLDGCLLPFDNTKVVYWLYKHGYDIEKLLESNQYLSENETDFDNFAFGIDQLSKGDEVFGESVKHNWTLDYVKKSCTELLNQYYYK